MSNTGLSARLRVRKSRTSTLAESAHCRSSKTTTSRERSASAARLLSSASNNLVLTISLGGDTVAVGPAGVRAAGVGAAWVAAISPRPWRAGPKMAAAVGPSSWRVMSRSTPTTGPYTRPPPSAGVHTPTATSAPAWRACSPNFSIRQDLPIPASPPTSTVRVPAWRSASNAAPSNSSSASRPTNTPIPGGPATPKLSHNRPLTRPRAPQ